LMATGNTGHEIIVVESPFDRSQRRTELVPMEVSNLLEIHKKLIPADVSVKMSINGQIIEEAFWGVTFLKPQDQLAIIPVIEGGGNDNKGMWGAIAMIAFTMWGAPYLAGMLTGGVTTGLGYNMLMIGLVVGGGLLISSLVPQPELSDSGSSVPQIYSWQPNTVQKQGEVIPKYYGKNKLNGNIISTYTEMKDDEVSQILYALIALGEGPVVGIEEVSGVKQVWINDQIHTNFEDVEIEEALGLDTQDSISFFMVVKAQYQPNLKVIYGTPRTYTAPDNDFDGLEIELVFDRGLFYAKDDGSIGSNSVQIKIEISGTNLGGWVTLVNDTISNDSTSILRKTFDTNTAYTGGSGPIEILNGVKYDIRVTKLTAEKSSSRYGDSVRFYTVREIISDGFQYPFLSLVGIKALATDQISGSLNVAATQLGAIIAVSNGTVWTLEYNNNPAWVLWDIFTQPVIIGDGSTGNPYTVVSYSGVDPERLDLDKFIELAEWCDDSVPDGDGGTEKRMTFNGGFSEETSVWDAALRLCGIAGCVPILQGTKISLAIDKPSSPVQLFNMGNILKSSFKQSFLPFIDRASEIEIHYLDESQDFDRTTLTVFDDNINNPQNKVILELFGVTKESEAWRLGMRRLSKNLQEYTMIEFQASIDAIACCLGDVIIVQHDIPEWNDGGRVVSAGSDYIVVDKNLERVEGTEYSLQLRLSTDELLSKTVTTTYTVIATAAPIGITVNGDVVSDYPKGTIVTIIGSTGNDGDYTVADAVYDTGGTTEITFNETLPDATGDGKIYFSRKIYVTVAFETVPTTEDLYVFGIPTAIQKLYRVLSISRSSEQIATITAVNYSDEIYDGEDVNSPTVFSSSKTPSYSDTNLGNQPTLEDIQNRFPIQLFNGLGDTALNVPFTRNFKWTDNSPSAGYVKWESDDGVGDIKLLYAGTEYTITAGSSNKKYIYWDTAYTGVMRDTDTLGDVIGTGKWLMAFNDTGVAYPAEAQKIIHGGIIQASTITADRLSVATLSAIQANLGTVTSGELILTLDGDKKLKISTSGIQATINGGTDWFDIIGVSGATVGITADRIVAGYLQATTIDSDTLAGIVAPVYLTGPAMALRNDPAGTNGFENIGTTSTSSVDKNEVGYSIIAGQRIQGGVAYSPGGGLGTLVVKIMTGSTVLDSFTFTAVSAGAAVWGSFDFLNTSTRTIFIRYTMSSYNYGTSVTHNVKSNVNIMIEQSKNVAK